MRQPPVEITISVNDLICPITRDLFSNPVMTVCGHFFENSALEEWLESNKNCPCCKEEIKKNIRGDDLSCFNDSSFMKNLVQKAVHKYPQLLKGTDNALTHLEIPFQLSELTCPLTGKIMFDPVVTGCNHLFENAAIKQHTHCPCCNEKICIQLPYVNKQRLQKYSTSIRNHVEGNKVFFLNHSLFISNLIEKVIQKYPKLQFSRYFSVRTLVNLIETGHRPDYVENLFKTTNCYNLIDHHKGTSVLRWLIRQQKFDLLIHNKALGKMISIESLNAPSIEGDSAVFWFCNFDTTIRLLNQDPELLSKITQEGLNAIHIDNKGKPWSAIFQLAQTEEGRNLIHINAEFRSKINETGLNIKTEAGTAVYELMRRSPGLQLFVRHSDLCKKITAEGLNTACALPKRRDESALLILVSNHEGIALLMRDHHLRSQITEEGLNRVCRSGPFRNQSPRLILESTKNGLILLKKIQAASDKSNLFFQPDDRLRSSADEYMSCRIS